MSDSHGNLHLRNCCPTFKVAVSTYYEKVKKYLKFLILYLKKRRENE